MLAVLFCSDENDGYGFCATDDCGGSVPPQKKRLIFRVGSGTIAGVYGEIVFIYFVARHAFRLGRVRIAIAGAV